jgi:hypothetical protein
MQMSAKLWQKSRGEARAANETRFDNNGDRHG